MIIVQWLLTLFFSFIALIQLAGALSGDPIVPLLLMVIAIVLVLPPLNSMIREKLGWLKFRFLRIFLAIIVFIVSFATTPVPEFLGFEAMAVCRQVDNNPCTVSETRIVTQTAQLFVTAQSADPIEKVRLQVHPLNDKNSAIITQEYSAQDILQGEQSYVIPVDASQLEVGSYEIAINPIVNAEDKSSQTSKQTITVWPRESDVTRRNLGGDLAEVSSFRVLKNVQVCTFTLAEAEQEEILPCPSSFSEIPSNAETIAFEAQINNPAKDNVNLDFVLRVNVKGTYEILREKTLSIEPDLDFMTYYLTLPEEGMPPGDYDMIASLQTKDDKLIRKQFTVIQ